MHPRDGFPLPGPGSPGPGPQRMNGHARGAGIVLPDGTPASQLDPMQVAQQLAIQVPQGVVGLPIVMREAVAVVDEHLAANPGEPTPPALGRTIELMRMVARWQDEARGVLERHGREHAAEQRRVDGEEDGDAS